MLAYWLISPRDSGSLRIPLRAIRGGTGRAGPRRTHQPVVRGPDRSRLRRTRRAARRPRPGSDDRAEALPDRGFGQAKSLCPFGARQPGLRSVLTDLHERRSAHRDPGPRLPGKPDPGRELGLVVAVVLHQIDSAALQ